MTVGFAVREAAAYNYDNLGILIAENVLIMSGPPIYAVTNYLVLGRCLYYLPYLSPIHPGRVVTTFLGVDFIVEVLIGSGVSRAINTTNSPSNRKVGETLVKSALIIQAIMFLLFITLAAHFHRRARRASILPKNLQTIIIVLYISSTLITIRCLYRTVEYFQGYTGDLYTHEAYFWVFEAALMWTNTAMLNIWHPGRFLPRDYKLYLSRDGVTEIRGPGWKDDRGVVVSLLDPFDLIGLFRGNDKKTEFWNMAPGEWEAQEARETAEKERLAALPRGWLWTVLDPLHLYGYGGYFQRMKREGKARRKAKKAARRDVETAKAVGR